MLVGQEQHLAPPLDPATLVERPLQSGPGVARGADRAAMATGERLDGSRRVHVGHRDHQVRDAHLGEVVPGVLDLADRGHVRHRAPGGKVGKHHLLVVGGQDVC